MNLPEVGEPSWGFVQWAVTALSTLAATIAAFSWRLMARLERMSLAIAQQRADFEAYKQANEGSLMRLAESVAQMNVDHYRLREAMGSLPNRSDLRDLEDRIGERIEALALRFDRALEKRGI